MWKENHYRLVHNRDRGEGQNVKSFSTRQRKWRKLSQQVATIMSSDDFVINGIFLDLDDKGYKRRCDKVTFSKESGTFSLCCSKYASTSTAYIWSNRWRFVRIKSKMYRFSAKKKQHKITNYSYRRSLNLPSKKERALNRRKAKATQSNIVPNPSDTEQNFEDNYDFIEEKNDDLQYKRTRFPKRLPRRLKYLYSDASVEKRHSKKKSHQLKSSMEDFVFAANKKPEFHNDMEEETDDDEFIISSRPCASLKLSDFFTLDIVIKCDLDGSLPESQLLIHKSTDNSYDEISEVDCKKQADENATSPTVTTFEYALSDKTHFKVDKPVDDLLENKEIVKSNPLMVFLSRFTTRPDNLRKDFKLRYKEAQCKPRRFIIDISQLAYQNLVLNGKAPLPDIPHLDLTLYLVFSFLKEGKDDADQYRVELNSTLLLNNPENVLAPLFQEEITSVHEIMQKALTVLNSLDTSQIKRKKQIALKDNVNQKALHSFNLLTSACKWNTQIIDYPLSLEWAEDSSSITHLTLLLDPDSNKQFKEKFQSQILPAETVLSKKMKGHHVKQGPNSPLLCGICLQEFTGNEFFYPLALCICSHWFCEHCWKANFRLQSSKVDHHAKFKCIEEGCSFTVDPITMLSILPVQNVRDYQFVMWKSTIENTPQLKLCTNPSCQRIIFAKNSQQSNDNDQNINVTCLCLYQKCFSCMLQPHWPISCGVAKIYQRRMTVLDHDNFHRRLEDKEFPDMVLKGKCCPKCGAIIQANFQFSGLKSCVCGCVMCWPCGKEVRELQHDLHESCIQKFQIEDNKLKQRLNSQSKKWTQDGEMSRWYKLALFHRQNQHPQVVSILYNMACRVAEAVSGISRKGKYVGNAKQAAIGLKSHFRKLANIKLKLLLTSEVMDSKAESIRPIKSNCYSYTKDPTSAYVPEIKDEIDKAINPFQSNSSNCMYSGESLRMEMLSPSNSYNVESPDLQCDPILKKAISNIVDTKLELHHVIEHVAILLEYSHALHQPGKVIRSLERAEDLCTYLDMLLQPTHVDGSARIIPSFLRLRTQIISVLTNLQCCLRENKMYHNSKIA